ncbi:MAG: hypothetical protein JSW40_04180, partial [Candidatus Omnitrophota bacterium]
MGENINWKKATLLSVSALLLQHCLNAADLDDLYAPLLEKGRIFYSAEGSYFRLKENGIHGSLSYDRIESTPEFYSFHNFFLFSPIEAVELGLGFGYTSASAYERSVYDPTENLAGLYEFDVRYLQDYDFYFRGRQEPFEFYVDFSESRQKAKWEFASFPDPTSYFTYLDTHFEDLKAGLRYLSPEGSSQDETSLSQVRLPLLGDGQIHIEAELGYVQGKLTRASEQYYLGQLYSHYFYHNMRGHFVPRCYAGYGVSDTLEARVGFAISTPLKYKYDYQLHYPDTTSRLTVGTYTLKNDIFVPLQVRYRPYENVEICLSSDYHFISQKLTYWQKDRNDSTTA